MENKWRKITYYSPCSFSYPSGDPMKNANPPPMISYGTARWDLQGVNSTPVSVEVKRIFQEALAKEVPSAQLTNRWAEGSEEPVIQVWRPNGYRRKISIVRKDPETSMCIRGVYSDVVPLIGKKNRNGCLYVHDYQGYTLQVGSKWVTVYSSQKKMGRVTYEIRGANYVEIAHTIALKVKEIQEAFDAVLLDFVKRTKIFSNGHIEWEAFEDYTTDETIRKHTNKNRRFYMDGIKKVYEDGIEFVRSPKFSVPGEQFKQYMIRKDSDVAESIIVAELAAQRREGAKHFDLVMKELADLKGVHRDVMLASKRPDQRKLSRWLG